jgi:hypothetical protein
MARITVGLIFHTDCNEADEIIEKIRQLPLDLVHVQQSYSKLWIKKGDQP